METTSHTSSARDALKLQSAAQTQAARLPALLVDAEKIAGSLMLGLHGRHRAGPGESFWQYRPYDSSDDSKMIDWRQSARSPSRLYIRQTEWESADTVYLWVARGGGFDFQQNISVPTKQARAELLITALAILLNRAGERICLLNDGTQKRPMMGRDAPQRFAVQLLARPHTDHVPPAPETRLPAHAVFLSDFFTPLEQLEEWIRRASADGIKGHLLQINDPSEEEFPFEGRLSFYESAGEDGHTFGDARAVQKTYQQRFLAHRASLSDLCRRHGWQFTHHCTASPAIEALMVLHNALSGDA